MSSKHYDVLVVGAGVIGLSIAYHIKQTHPDLSVLIVDRKPAPAQGDTAKSMAAVRDTFTSDVNRLLASSSIDFYRHVQTKLGFDLDLELIGYLWLLTDPQFKSFESVAPGLTEQGVRFRVLEPNELSGMVPDLVLNPSSEQSKLMDLGSIYKAVLGSDCGTVAPDLIAKFFETEYRKLNGEFQFGVEAKTLRLVAKNSLDLPGEPYVWQDKSIAGIETAKGPILADVTVIAAGARTAMLFDPIGIDCYMKPKKRQVFQLKGTSLDRLLNIKGFNEENTIPFTILPKGGVYFRPVRGERAFWVSVADDVGRAFSFEEEPAAEEAYFTMNIYPILSEYFPCFTNVRPSNSWAGFYDLNSLDGTPIVDKIDNCILATGMSGSGIMKADSIGRLAAAIYDGKNEATLFGDRTISTSRLGLTNRNVGQEQFVI
ncbi:MAG: FAD-binding oxidoreductase [Candidatus Bathyarchaeia archaeon]